MSWLAGLAGKAEDFLNKVDQTAASALHKDELLTKQKRSSSYSNFSDLAPTTQLPFSLSQSVSSPQRKAKTSSETSLGKRNWSPVNKPKRAQDDEQLLEFLNSCDVDKPRKTSSLPPLNSMEELRENEVAQTQETLNINVENRNDEPEHADNDVNNSVEMENNLLRNEISSLNQEMCQLLQKVKATEAELQRTRDSVALFNKNSSENEKMIQELHNREIDLRESLAAKDSQLAVLRVRLQEADEELKAKRVSLETLQNDRERVLNDQTNSNGLHSQALQTLRDRLEENENALMKEMNKNKTIQFESSQRAAKLDEENRVLSANYLEIQQQLVSEKEGNKDLLGQIKVTKNSLQSARQELSEYKQKAQKILQSKEKLITSLKVATNSETATHSEAGGIAITVELEEVKQERDMVREDLLTANGSVEKLRNELDYLEIQLQNQASLAQDKQKDLEEQLDNEVKVKDDLFQENSHVKEEIQFMKEELCRQKSMFQSRIADRDNELEKLRKQLTMRVMNNNQTELESRLHTLTESLIHKQTMLETLNTEKNSLVLQLERMEQQLKDNQSYTRRGNATTLNVDDSQRRLPQFLAENPFDGQVARKVKRAYNSVDKFSVRLGIFLRRYPMARIMVIVYMGLLHLFVMAILLTYSPEIHTTDPL